MPWFHFQSSRPNLLFCPSPTPNLEFHSLSLLFFADSDSTICFSQLILVLRCGKERSDHWHQPNPLLQTRHGGCNQFKLVSTSHSSSNQPTTFLLDCSCAKGRASHCRQTACCLNWEGLEIQSGRDAACCTTLHRISAFHQHNANNIHQTLTSAFLGAILCRLTSAPNSTARAPQSPLWSGGKDQSRWVVE